MTDTVTGSGADHSPLTADDAEPATIRFDDVGKQFDDTWVLRNVDLDIRPGTVYGLVGPSGCGKTTTVRLALGYFWPDEGSVEVLGADPVTRANRDRRRIGYLPQHPVLFEELSLWQNLNYHASLWGVVVKRGDRLRHLLDLVGLGDDADKRVSEASGGMKRRLALAATLVSEPPLLLLDEPTAGVDPILRRQLWDEFRRLRDEGTTLVVTTQFVEEAAYCDQVAVLAHGGVAADATPDDLIDVAYGGRRFDVQFADSVGGPTIGSLGRIDGVASARAAGPRTVRIAVAPSHVHREDGTNAIDETLRGRLHEEAAVEIDSVSEVAIDWNDVFAQIVAPDDQPDDADDAERDEGPGDGSQEPLSGATTAADTDDGDRAVDDQATDDRSEAPS